MKNKKGIINKHNVIVFVEDEFTTKIASNAFDLIKHYYSAFNTFPINGEYLGVDQNKYRSKDLHFKLKRVYRKINSNFTTIFYLTKRSNIE